MKIHPVAEWRYEKLFMNYLLTAKTIRDSFIASSLNKASGSGVEIVGEWVMNPSKNEFALTYIPTDLDGMYVYRQKIGITDQNILNF